VGRGWVNAVREAAGAKKGKLFTKLAKEITVAVRMGGANAEGNARLKSALKDAQKNSMPKDTVDRAIKRGTGPSDGAELEEIVYEGYGPHGVAVLVETLTDNRNRTVQDLRAVFVRNKGNLGESGSVAWMFNRVGAVTALRKEPNSDPESVAIEAGADDVEDAGSNHWTFYTSATDFGSVGHTIETMGFEVIESGVVYRPKTPVELSAEQEKDLGEFIEAIYDNDDVKKVHPSA
jgi:YebC/PmpR family DNA-binding regulatory protein